MKSIEKHIRLYLKLQKSSANIPFQKWNPNA